MSAGTGERHHADAAVPVQRRFSTFATVWTGQFISLVGSELSAFALGLWAYRQTGSATLFTLILFFANVPIVVLLPFAGALVDRWNRRSTLITANLVSGLVMLALAALLATGQMRLWHIYPAVGLIAAASAFHWPAYAGLPALLVPRDQLTRAAGLIELGRAGSQALAPVLAGVLVGGIGLAGVVAVDFVTFLVAVGSLLLVSIAVPPAAAGPQTRSLRNDVALGWRYIIERPGLAHLLLFFVALNVFFSAALVLLVPMVAAFSGDRALGVIASVGTAGLVGGALLMTLWGGMRRKIYNLLGSVLLIGISAVLASFGEWPPLVAAGLFGFYLGYAAVNASAQAIWQVKVPVELQGRVFALRRMVATATVPVAFLAAGPVADRIFEPLMAPGGSLSGSVGVLIGTGHGRGIAALVLLLGLVVIAIGLAGFAAPRLRRLEYEVADGWTGQSR